MTLATPRRRLRAMISAGELVVAPGVYDGATAMLVERAGFAAAYMTGAGVSATFGLPDYGLLSMNEMAEQAGRIARALTIPLIADADTGYGNALNVTRTIREYESRGVAALHIEDQVAPKRCGHLSGKEVVPRDEFVAKIRAAVAARGDPELMIIARTDARAELGLDEAIARIDAALAAGADMAFVEAVRDAEEIAAVPRRVNGPCLLNMVRGGLTPIEDTAEAARLGYAMVIAPGVVLGEMVGRVTAALDAFRRTGVHPEGPPGMSPQTVFAAFGADRWNALRDMVEL